MSTTSTIPTHTLTGLVVAACREVTEHGTLPTVAMLGQLLGPDVPLEQRLGLLHAGMAYLDQFLMARPWDLHPKLSDALNAVAWVDPLDELVIDVPRNVHRNQTLLDDDTRRHVRRILAADLGVHRLVVVRLPALAAPLASVGLDPELPLRPRPLIGTNFAFGLTAADAPTPRQENN